MNRPFAIEELEASAAATTRQAHQMSHQARMDALHAEALGDLAQCYAGLAKNEALLQARGL